MEMTALAVRNFAESFNDRCWSKKSGFIVVRSMERGQNRTRGLDE
jgi:hypothetical protein